MLSVSALLQRAALLQADAQDEEKRGEYPSARARTIEAWRLTAPLLAGFPDAPKIIYAHAQSEFFMGYVDWRVGDARNARLRFQRYAALANRLTGIEPQNPDWRRERAYAASNLGMITLRQAVDPTQARPFFAAADVDFQAVARAKPDDPDILSEIADNEAWLADVARVAGDLPGALAHRQRQRQLLAAEVAKSPRDARVRVNMVASELGLARVEAAQGRWNPALARLKAAHREAASLATADPDNKSVARQKRAIEVFEAQTWLTMPLAMRPPLPMIAATLGDCDAEWSKPRNDELAALCALAEARLAFASGERDTARRSLARLSTERPFRLSERWRINFADEAQHLREATTRKQ